MERITEQSSLHDHLESKSTEELLAGINQEDQKVALAVRDALPSIAKLVEAIVSKMNQGGRLFYIGAGTSGRLGVLDASECPPTYGVSADMVIGVIAGGDRALRNSIEHAEDDVHQAWLDLEEYNIGPLDTVVGIASSGTTPYVVHGLKDCRENGVQTAGLSCNPGAPILDHADFPIVTIVGPEFLTGSTRMKSGTAQKLVLNMISTTVMIRMGRVQGNRMVDMQLSNDKLKDRGAKMIVERTGMTYEEAVKALAEHGGVRAVLNAY